jgi:hypothetical protein
VEAINFAALGQQVPLAEFLEVRQRLLQKLKAYNTDSTSIFPLSIDGECLGQ